MNEEQLDDLLLELTQTRQTFEHAIKAVKWNRVNTITQYCLLVLVFVLGGLGLLNYLNDTQDTCERGNEFRLQIHQSQQANALSIGTALAAVLGGSQEDIQKYMEAYEQTRPEQIPLREC